jgi:hypothetical protein
LYLHPNRRPLERARGVEKREEPGVRVLVEDTLRREFGGSRDVDGTVGCGAAGSSGRQRRTVSAAACASVCGKLPMPVARPGRRTGARRVGVMGSYYTDTHDAHTEAGFRVTQCETERL